MTENGAPAIVYIADLKHHAGEVVRVRGWLYNQRKSSSKLRFLIIRDGTGVMQATAYKPDLGDELFERAKALTQETAVVLTGMVKADPRAPGGFELGVQDILVVHATADYPITPKSHGTDFLMKRRHLWLRSMRQHACMRLRHTVIRTLRNYFDDRGFTLLDTPILTPNACEGTTSLFETTYFDEKAYLAQSGQLYGEAGAMAFGKIYTLGPTFRAEKSKTRRHLIEFWMLEPEVAFAELDEILDLAEDMTTHLIAEVLRECRSELDRLERDTEPLEWIRKPFPRITYDDALAILKKKGHDVPWGEDFGAEHETVLSQHFDRPVFITRYPSEMKAFYMQPDPERAEVALCVDMLAPEGYGEIIGGGQRIHDLALLETRIAEHDLPRDAFEWYCDLRRYGSAPHSGFGLGIERAVAWLGGLPHVRETIPFPRMLYHLHP